MEIIYYHLFFKVSNHIIPTAKTSHKIKSYPNYGKGIKNDVTAMSEEDNLHSTIICIKLLSLIHNILYLEQNTVLPKLNYPPGLLVFPLCYGACAH